MLREPCAKDPHTKEAGHAQALCRVLSGKPVEVVRLLAMVDVAPDRQETGT